MIYLKLKTIILIIIAGIILILINNKKDNIIIPKESIRIRIISNSNNEFDIKEKAQVKKNVEKELYSLLKNVKSIEEAKDIINNSLEKLNIIIDNTTNLEHNINFGYNYFPKKIYKGVVYEEGNYDSLVITLWEGQGNNWWCVLFPPLCLLEDNNNTKDVEYKFFVKEIIDKVMHNFGYNLGDRAEIIPINVFVEIANSLSYAQKCA